MIRREARKLYSYEGFKGKLVEDLAECLDENAGIEVMKVLKNNDVELDGVCVRFPGEFAAPTVYMEALYQQYIHGEPYDMILKKVVCCYMDREQQWTEKVDYYRDFSYTKHQVVFKIVKADRNQTFLEGVPHRKLLDFAMVYYCIVEDEQCGWGTINITNEHMEMWQTTEEELYSLAMKNVIEIVPPIIQNLFETVMEAFSMKKTDVKEENADSEQIVGISDMFLLTNNRKNFGAAVIFYPEVLERFAEEKQSDFYILPSSIHEVILLCTDGVTKEKKELLKMMINDVNHEHLIEEEFLSEHVYFYSREKKTIEML